jgi:hypothetical protein
MFCSSCRNQLDLSKINRARHLSCFRTNITDHAYLQSELESNWNVLPEEVRSAYGQNYYDNYKVRLIVQWVLTVGFCEEASGV